MMERIRLCEKKTTQTLCFYSVPIGMQPIYGAHFTSSKYCSPIEVQYKEQCEDIQQN